MTSLENIVVIPARKGSQRVRNKNIRLMAGKPLIWHTINYAKKYIKNSKIIVSTDCKEVKKIAKKFYLDIYDRPVKLASSKSSMYDVLDDINKQLQKKTYQPTLRTTWGRQGVVFGPSRHLADFRKIEKLVDS